MLILQRPEISLEEVSENRSVFTIEPLEPGFGLTLGNTMRRALLSRVPGVAVTGVKIEGVNHEFTSIPGVIEDVLDVLLNLKRLVLRVEDLDSHTLTVKAKGPGEVKASQIQCPAGVEVINTDLSICSLFPAEFIPATFHAANFHFWWLLVFGFNLHLSQMFRLPYFQI